LNTILKTTERRAGRSGQGRGATDLVASVSFTMPVPPSVNECFRNLPGKGRVATKVYRDWIDYALTNLRLQQLPIIHGHVLVNMGFEIMGDRGDVDNRIKPTLDVLTKAGLIVDDRFVVSPVASKLPYVNGMAHIEIWPSQKLTAEFHPSPDGARGGWIFYAPQPNGEHDGLIHQ